jgi:predicted deacetylase
MTPTGFIAPAWLLGNDAERAVRALDFQYTTRIATVRDFKSGDIHSARSLVWSVRAPWRRVCSLAWNKLLALSLRNAPLLRVGIHPPDWDHAAIRNQILSLTSTALAGRRAMTYQQWLASMRGQE